jgi:hypothetical protein
VGGFLVATIGGRQHDIVQPSRCFDIAAEHPFILVNPQQKRSGSCDGEIARSYRAGRSGNAQSRDPNTCASCSSLSDGMAEPSLSSLLEIEDDRLGKAHFHKVMIEQGV